MAEMKCRICGCDDLHACITDDGPCFWVEPGLCSACAAIGAILNVDEFRPKGGK